MPHANHMLSTYCPFLVSGMLSSRSQLGETRRTIQAEMERGASIMGQSEIARVRQQIAAEYLSAQLGLSGLAEGITRHCFITVKMERMGASFETLAQMMGKEQAIQIVAQTLQEVPERATRQNVLQVSAPRTWG
jgi:hypothetical protein